MSKLSLNELLTLVEQKTGQAPRQRGADNYQTLCPAHADENASMSIKKGDKQPWVVFCHAGCTHTDIMAALGVAPPSLNGNGNGATAVPTNGQLAKKPKQPLGEPIARYPYHDAGDNFLYEKLRYHPKTFRVRNKSGWGLGGKEPVPYRLPQLLKTPTGGTVFVVEGEKDADSLVKLGLCATCNFDGAGRGKWRISYNQYFTERSVVVIPDNDDAGRLHAKDVAESVASVASMVKLVELPGLAEHGDVTDWIEAGGTVEKLLELTSLAQPITGRVRDFNLRNATTEDYCKGLRYLGYQIRLNSLDNTLEVNGKPMDDVQAAGIRSDMFDLGFSGKGRIEDAQLVEANRNRYHPIKEFFESNQWDGQDHLGRLLTDYLEVDTPEGISSLEFGYTAFKRWLIGAVAKVYTGTRNYMMVWDGGQELGKSTLARWLNPLPEYHHEGQINPEDKDHLRYLATHWTWEVAEVDATVKRADIAALKDFISKQEVTVRPAYARYDLVRPAMASLIGTINGDGAGFLRDKTGSSRFLTLRLAAVNFDYMADIDPAQIWAQAYHWYRAGEPWRLTPAEEAMRNTINSDYETESIIETLFNLHYRVDPSRVDLWCSSVEILQVLEGKGLSGSQRINLIELQTILQKRGAVKTRKIENGKKQTVYLGVWYSEGEVPVDV
jgi:putative DNA primase/helicase